MLTILKQIPFFASIDKQTHEAIIKNIRLDYYPQNYTIFSENDKAQEMYIIKRGKVGVFIERSNKQPFAILGNNDFFGEMALVSNKPRNATVRTLEDSEIFVLHEKVFDELISINPEIAAKISEEIINRTNENEKELPPKEQEGSLIFS